ncbi:MAG TPA: tyrosine-type recombinase/integrase [Thermoanaerobaculia bacterium]|nr:tyrosine-type recombinase/integrase [Thermoanaerobaculia bacterium]
MEAVTYQVRNSEYHLTPAELAQLISRARTERDRLMVEVLAYTGMRRAELRSLRKSDIDVHRERLIVRHGKGNKQRVVFVPRHVAEKLSAHAHDHESEFLFVGRGGGPMSLRNINYILTRVGREAGVCTPNPRYVGVGPHLIRHSFARNWKRSGGSIESLQKMLGHSSVKTTLDCYGTEDQREVEANYRQRHAALVAAADCPV